MGRGSLDRGRRPRWTRPQPVIARVIFRRILPPNRVRQCFLKTPFRLRPRPGAYLTSSDTWASTILSSIATISRSGGWKETRWQEDNVIYFEERIGDEVLEKTVRLTTADPNEYIEFVPTGWLLRLFLPRMSFSFDRQADDSTLFRADIQFRVGPIGEWSHRDEFEVVREHMKEEGETLKAWVQR